MTEVTPSPTAEPADLALTGRVYDAAVGPSAGIENATVSLVSCEPRRYPTSSGSDGSYELVVPAEYLNCAEVTLDAWKAGYASLSQTVGVSDLYAQPQRDYALQPLPHDVYLPLLSKAGPALQPTPTPAPPAFDPTAFDLDLELVTDEFNEPIHVTYPGDGSRRLFVVEKAGIIRIVENGTVNATPFLDIIPLVGSDGYEQGLLSVAFHPDYATNGYFFINYYRHRGRHRHRALQR